MKYFIFLMGLLPISMGCFLLGGHILSLKKSKCVTGTICGIGHETIYVPGATIYYIVVRLKEDGKDIELVTIHFFSPAPFFRKIRLAGLRKKHIGRRVHIYYNPDSKKRVLLREYMWKEFLWCVFLFFLGTILLLSGIYGWY